MLVAALAVVGLAWRLASGPMEADGLRPAVERLLAAQVKGGRAEVGRVQAVWFDGEKAAGLRLTDVSLKDGRNRPVLRADRVEAAVGLESLVLLSPAPSRLTADDFFAALSVSPQGAYQLGYDAEGEPVPLRLETLFRSLTGKPRRGKPVSYLRRLELTDGVVMLRQVKGPVGWRAALRQVTFTKHDGRLAARTSLSIDDGEGLAELDGGLSGAVGLGELKASGSLTGLTPARVFPAVGFTRSLSRLDAPVRADGRLQYAASRGITSADVNAQAGEGFLRAGRFVQRLEGARIATRYDPAARTVRVQSFQVDAEGARLDVTGSLRLQPRTAKAPARVRFTLATADSLLAIAPSAEPQAITDAALHGEYTPAEGRLEVRTDRLRVAHAPVAAWAILQRGPNPDVSWGLTAAVESGGIIGPAQAAAFWPEHLGRGARKWFVKSIHEAQISNFRLRADLPPGQMGRPKLANPMLNIAFDFEGASASITPTLPRIEDGVGSGVVQGDRFDMTMKTGRLLDIALSQGVIEIPRFKPKGVRATFKARAVGDIGQMLEVVDRKPLNLITPTGMSPRRLSGRADLMLEITRPMLGKVPLDDYGVRYEGRWENGSIRNVAGALDLDRGRMTVEGSLEKVSAKGVGQVGPYFGKIDFRSDLKGARAGSKLINLDGAVDVAGAMAGRIGQGEPLRARITTRRNEGQAVIRSDLVDGKASWTSHRRFLLDGVGEPAAWRAAGLPVGPGLPAKVPVKLTLGGSNGGWSGAIEADAYSGALTFTGGAAPSLRYVADITPDEARALGLGDLPLFGRAQRLVLDAGGAGRQGAADYSVGGMTGRVEWAPGKEKGAQVYRFQTRLDRDDLASLGAPFGPAAATPVEAVVEGARGGFAGQARMAGAAVRFTVSPERAGRRQIALDGEAPAASLVKLGLAQDDMIDGAVALAGRFERSADGSLSGRAEAGLDRAALAIPDSDWKKPAGRKARLYADLTTRPDGATTLERIVAEGPGLELAASGSLAKGRLVRIDIATLRLDGLFEGRGTLAGGEAGPALRLDGGYLDARPLIRRAQRRGAAKGAAAKADSWRVDAAVERVRLTEGGYLKDVKLSGVWGASDARRLTIAASTLTGSALSARAWPEGGTMAIAFKVADLGDAARALGGFEDLKGGAASGKGRLVPGGYDLTVDVRDLRVARAPALAQLLTVASLQGLADTLGGEGILFNHIEAPVKVRGSQVTLDQAEMSGQALGITAKGTMDLEDRTLDVSGVIAPAYALNSMAGVLPVLGPVLISRKGEGIFGMTYSARGSFDEPHVVANPLSFAAPGVLRRMFETPAAQPQPAG